MAHLKNLPECCREEIKVSPEMEVSRSGRRQR